MWAWTRELNYSILTAYLLHCAVQSYLVNIIPVKSALRIWLELKKKQIHSTLLNHFLDWSKELQS